ncbi:MAG: hypothetical protein ACYTFW_00730 [Planctomycetota bacterium]|jgi:hypothetical protein
MTKGMPLVLCVLSMLLIVGLVPDSILVLPAEHGTGQVRSASSHRTVIDNFFKKGGGAGMG